MDAYSKFLALENRLRTAMPWERELVTTLRMPDGTTQEIAHLSRVIPEKITRKGNVTYVQFADVDLAALDRVFPFEAFTVEDFPEIFVDHRGRLIPQGVGTARKVPLAWITKSGGTWKYAGPKVIGAPGAVLTVYRGTRPGEGSVVPAAEYTVGTAIGASTGVQVLTVNFTREQLDRDNRPYNIEIDVTLPGSRSPSAESARLLALCGVSTDASFTAAAAADIAAGFLIDAVYGGTEQGRTVRVIVNDHLRVARGWFSQTPTGAWGIVQDVAKAATKDFSTSSDQFVIEEWGDGDRKKTVRLYFRPKLGGRDQDYAPPLTRQSTGASGEYEIKCPYVDDKLVADKLISYYTKRLNTLRIARGRVHAAQIANGELINVTDKIHFRGTKGMIATGITRPADSNRLTLREYDPEVYVYTAGILPADATNVYTPDYSFTKPAAPTGLQIVTLTASAGIDGKISANALIRAVPPAANWAKLMVRLEDTVTKEAFLHEFFLTGLGNYDVTIPGLRHNRLYSIMAYAENANGVKGDIATLADFTTANYSNAPLAPTGLTIVSQGTTAGPDGTLRAWALLRAVPPVANFGYLKARLTDTTTGGQHTQQLFLVGGNYEAVFEGLNPARLHSAETWAVNQTNVDGAIATIANFNTANYTTAPSAPNSISVQQLSPRQVLLTYGFVADPAGGPVVRRYIVFKQTGAGNAFVEVVRTDATHWIDDNIVLGTTQYGYKVRAEDANHNESGDSGTVTITPQKVVGDAMITNQGVTGSSIGNGAINRDRTTTSTGSGSGTVSGNSNVTVGSGGNPFTYWVNMGVTGSVPDYCGLMGSPVNDQCVFNIRNNNAGSQTWYINYRYTNA